MSIKNKLKMYRRKRGTKGYVPTDDGIHDAINTSDVIIRRLAKMHWICNQGVDKQEHKSNEGDNGDGGQDSGFHFNQSFLSN